MPHTSPNIAAASEDDSSVDSSPHVEMLEWKRGNWPYHQNVADDYTYDCDLVGPIVEREIITIIIKILFSHFDATFNILILNNNDSGPDIMMVNFSAIPIFPPTPW